ncbi:MAG: nitrous oxide reductase family maturation protein NosD [Bacteroidetes bacterium]|nr:nitrous oxide reductase family maturation protein NosD [Bacteroidota bacterium]
MQMRALLLFCLLPLSAWAAVIRVENGKTIRQAIEMAQPGDSILIAKGIYREGNLTIKKPLTLAGIDYPVLDGENKYEILTVTGPDVTITGLKFINTGTANIEDIAAIKALDVMHLRVIRNKFENAFFGIYFANSNNSWVQENTLIGESKSDNQAGNGIHMWKCDHMTIEKNEIRGHRDGIYFEFVTKSRVADNFSHENQRYGLHFMFSHDDEYESNIFRNNGAGIAVMYSNGVKMKGNRFEENSGNSSYGLLLKEIADSRIIDNIFRNNSIGIYMEGCSRGEFIHNTFTGNGWALRVQASCDANTFTRNGFFSNSFDVATNGSISLNDIHHNYWDKYEGYDLNKDGVGDIPFRPVSLYGMVVEKMPISIVLWRSILVLLLDRTEKILPAVTPENLVDKTPLMKFDKTKSDLITKTP